MGTKDSDKDSFIPQDDTAGTSLAAFDIQVILKK
jgi:hypothetical protein